MRFDQTPARGMSMSKRVRITIEFDVEDENEQPEATLAALLRGGQDGGFDVQDLVGLENDLLVVFKAEAIQT